MANNVRITAGVQDNASKPIKDIRDAWMRLQNDGSGALTAGIAAAASLQAFNLAGQAISHVNDFVRDSVAAAREEDASVARLNASLKANATAWDGNSAAVEAHIQANTAAAFSDDALRQSLGSLVASTHDVNSAFDLEATAIDLARFKNEDLSAATDELVKVQAGSFRSLKSLGIATDDITTSTQAFAAIQKVVSGQSEAFLATDAGKAEKLKVATDELSEAFGHLASGPLADAEQGLADFFNILSGAQGNKIAAAGDQWVSQLKEHFTDATQAELQRLQQILTEELDKSRHQLSLFGLDLPVGNFEGESDQIKKALDEVNQEIAVSSGQFEDHADRMKTGIDNVGSAIDHSSAFFHQFTTDAGETGAGLDNVASKAVAAANGFDTSLTPGMTAAEIAAKNLTDALNNIPRNIDVNFQFGGLGTGANPATNNPNAPQGSADAFRGTAGGVTGNQDALDAHNQALKDQKDLNDARQRAIDEANRKAQQAADAANRKAKQARDAAARQAKQDAADLARAQIDAGNEAFDKMAQAAHKYFDQLHAANLKAIQDAKDRADNDIEQQKRANLQPVTDAEAKLKQIQDARRLAQLQADLLNAQNETGVDPIQKAQDIQAANQALSDFTTQQAIDSMQANADAANAILDTKKAAQDADFANQTQAENDRHSAQVSAFDAALADLRKYLSQHPAEWAKANAAVQAVLKAAGVDYTASGAANANAYLAGLRSAFTTAGLPIGATFGTGKGGKTAPSSATLGSSLGDVGKLANGMASSSGSRSGGVYLDGRLVGEWIDLREGAANAVYNPVQVSTGSGTR